MVTTDSHRDHFPDAFDYLSAGEKQFRILQDFQKQTYVRTSAGWHLNGKPYTFEPIVGRLDNELTARLMTEDQEETDPAELVRRAWFGQAFGQHDRVVALASRALRSVTQPPDPLRGGAIVSQSWQSEGRAAAAMLSSALRALKESRRALEDTTPFDDGTYPPLMTSRAAAMCDVEQWEAAHELALAARDILDSDALRLVLLRIDAHFRREVSRSA